MRPHRVLSDHRMFCLSPAATRRVRATRRMLFFLRAVKRIRAEEFAQHPQPRHGAAKGIMNRNSFSRTQLVLQFVTAMILFGPPHFASAQVGPAVRLAPDISIFATATGAKPNFRYLYDRAVYGFSAG